CGGTFTAPDGSFQSPDYPSHYPNNQDCVYIISRPWGERITLSFTFFDLEISDFLGGCAYDNVTIQEGSSEDSPVINSFCDSDLPPVRRTFQNVMRIWFRSDNSVTGGGFVANYTSGVFNDSFFLLTDSRQRSVFHIDYDTFSSIEIPLSTVYTPFAVDYDPVDGRVYWTDFRTRDIRSALLNGSDIQQLWYSYRANATLVGLAVDPLSRLVFYVDAVSKEIGMVTMDSGHHKTIITVNVDAPGCITLDTMKGVMYWSDVGDVNKIESANYDGTGRRVLVNAALYVPNGLALDLANNRLYWVDSGNNTVESSDLNGNDHRVVYSRSYSHFFGLALHQDKLYITDWGINGASTRYSFLYEVTIDGNATIKGSARGKLNDVHIYSDDTWEQVCGGTFTDQQGLITSPRYPNNYPPGADCVYTITRPLGERITLTFTDFDLEGGFGGDCNFDNVTVQDGSLNSSPILDVLCGSELPSDVRSFQNVLRIWFRTDGSISGAGFNASYTSAVHKESFFLVTDSRQRSVFYIDYETFSYVSLPLDRVHTPFAVDYDPEDGRIYWTDYTALDIRSARLDGTANRQLWASYNINSSLTGLAVDPLSRLVFYVDAGSKVIGMVTIESGLHKTIITQDIDAPRCITLDTMKGTMYWSDVGSTNKIERANYDGSERRVLVTVGLHIPNGLALDLPNNRLYWVDAAFDRVESMELNGNNRRIVYSRPLSHFFGLALHQDKLYITDWGPSGYLTSTSYLLELTTDGQNLKNKGTARGKLNDIHIYSEDTRVQGPNGCGNNRDVCSHICIPSPSNTYKCMCPDGQSLTADQRTCRQGAGMTTPTTTPVPFTVQIDGPSTFDTDGAQTMTLLCDPDGSRRAINVTWNVMCDHEDYKTCLWRPKPVDDGKEITCAITYAGGQKGVDPPQTAPEIHGYKTGDMLEAGNNLAMSCIVSGGKPLVTSVIFSCNGHPDNTLDIRSVSQVHSILVFKPVRASDDTIRCVCTAQWKYVDWYRLSDSVILSVNGNADGQTSPIVWHAEQNPYDPLGYSFRNPVHNRSAVTQPPTYSNSTGGDETVTDGAAQFT
ncbi:hypothetical protein BaRGS_00026281, partial [Batillaria attramentaria]